ncbi:MAG: hypothetical protein VYE73_07975 [Acidobacteriota bacterium]|nr:hypothetical protein [Acidobacteriota bacterium]
MHRMNYGRKSGVIIDVCRPHGMCFDAAELDTILRWIQTGGENQAQRLQHQELAERAHADRIRRDMDPAEPEWNQDPGFGALTWGLGGFLTSLFND